MIKRLHDDSKGRPGLGQLFWSRVTYHGLGSIAAPLFPPSEFSHRTSGATFIAIPGAILVVNSGPELLSGATPLTTMDQNICAKLVSLDKIDGKKEGGQNGHFPLGCVDYFL